MDVKYMYIVGGVLASVLIVVFNGYEIEGKFKDISLKLAKPGETTPTTPTPAPNSTNNTQPSKPTNTQAMISTNTQAATPTSNSARANTNGNTASEATTVNVNTNSLPKELSDYINNFNQGQFRKTWPFDRLAVKAHFKAQKSEAEMYQLYESGWKTEQATLRSREFNPSNKTIALEYQNKNGTIAYRCKYQVLSNNPVKDSNLHFMLLAPDNSICLPTLALEQKAPTNNASTKPSHNEAKTTANVENNAKPNTKATASASSNAKQPTEATSSTQSNTTPTTPNTSKSTDNTSTTTTDATAKPATTASTTNTDTNPKPTEPTPMVEPAINNAAETSSNATQSTAKPEPTPATQAEPAPATPELTPDNGNATAEQPGTVTDIVQPATDDTNQSAQPTTTDNGNAPAVDPASQPLPAQ